MICPKCNERERAVGQRWCRECRNASRRKVDVPFVPGPDTPMDTLDTAVDTDGHVSKPRTCPNCQVLADEVAALKRELARARPAVVHPTQRSTSGVVSSALAAAEQQVRRIEVGQRSPIKKSAESPGGEMTPHGPNSQSIWGRSGRAG